MQETKTLVITTPYLEPHRPPITGALLCKLAKISGHAVNAVDLNISLFRYDKHLWWANKRKTYSFDYDIDIVPQELYETLLTKDHLDVDWILLTQLTMYDFAAVFDLCKWLRKNTNAKIVIGGPGLEFRINNNKSCGSLLLEKNFIDYYIFGEGELSLLELFKGNTSYPGINGTTPEQILDIEDLPLPDYDLYNLDLYDYPMGDKNFYIYGSRGCVKKCTFCDIPKYWPKYRYRSGTSIANEMIQYYEKYGCSNFYFADSLMNGSLKEFRSFCSKLASYSHTKFQWSGFFIIRPPTSHTLEFFDMIKDAGGFFLNVGIETGVDRIRFEMDKKFTNDDVEWHLENCSRIGLTNQLQLISTWPSETVEEHQEYLKIFSKWRCYVADGTISSASINGPPSLLEGAPLSLNPDLYVPKEHIDSPPSTVLFYKNKKNNDFTVAERYQRTINIVQEAMRNRWPLDRIETKLIEWNNLLKEY